MSAGPVRTTRPPGSRSQHRPRSCARAAVALHGASTRYLLPDPRPGALVAVARLRRLQRDVQRNRLVSRSARVCRTAGREHRPFHRLGSTTCQDPAGIRRLPQRHAVTLHASWRPHGRLGGLPAGVHSRRRAYPAALVSKRVAVRGLAPHRYRRQPQPSQTDRSQDDPRPKIGHPWTTTCEASCWRWPKPTGRGDSYGPRSIEDPERLDERRASVGLDPFATYEGAREVARRDGQPRT